MNNKPVAWRCNKFYETQEGWFYNENSIGEPLYTHPADLTDEEIKSEAKYLCHGWHSENPERLVLFARAILRKAQEK